jgi:hypothetical protein
MEIRKTNFFGGLFLMNNEYTVYDAESKQTKWNKGVDLFMESVLKPDNELRQAAHDQKCFHELMDVRENVLKYLDTLRWN